MILALKVVSHTRYAGSYFFIAGDVDMCSVHDPITHDVNANVEANGYQRHLRFCKRFSCKLRSKFKGRQEAPLHVAQSRWPRGMVMYTGECCMCLKLR